MHAAVYLPAPFMQDRGAAKLGPLYEMRIYTYAVGAIPRVIEKWSEHVPEREKYSPLVGAWYSDVGDPERVDSPVGVRQFRGTAADSRRNAREGRVAAAGRHRAAAPGKQTADAVQLLAASVMPSHPPSCREGARP